MNRIYCGLIVTILLLTVRVQAETLPPPPVTNTIPKTGDNDASTYTLEFLGRWHGGPVYTSAVSGSYLFFGSGGTIRVIKIEKETYWKEVGSITLSGIVGDLQAAGPYLYVADTSGALRIIDISLPEKLKEIGHVMLPASSRAVAVCVTTSSWQPNGQALSLPTCQIRRDLG